MNSKDYCLFLKEDPVIKARACLSYVLKENSSDDGAPTEHQREAAYHRYNHIEGHPGVVLG